MRKSMEIVDTKDNINDKWANLITGTYRAMRRLAKTRVEDISG
jgi:hypothetical protein